ncbi:MAG: TonB-dependent receptor plug domain-containing protein [Bacteroidetes bacterium]|nr:TonB-dependent receptor plug domain-containing protein [Bacteroidota bacterium]
MKRILLLIVLMSSLAELAFAQNIKGKISDAQTGESLTSATIVIEGTNRGTLSNIRGEYLISGIAEGTHKLSFSYIGYEKQTIEVEAGKETITLDVALATLSIQGLEVTVTAQAAGQRAAINQQVKSNSIKNVVSAQRIQEIPENSAAEAVGRLPGVTIKNGSVIVRGLSPQFSKIQVDGTDMASTSLTGRSSSLDMISQYMLEGIEMTKSAMADHEGDVIGARVNLIIKEAPKTPTFEALFQNGYNTLSESFGNQKLSLSGSSRFFEDKLGVFGQVSFERNETATNSMGAGYLWTGDDIETGEAMFDMGSLGLSDSRAKLLGRKGASLVMDYKTGLTKIKMSNFFSSSENESVGRSMSYGSTGKSQSRSMWLGQNKLLVMTNALRIEQVLGRFEIDGGLSHSYSKNESPGNISTGAGHAGSIPNDADWSVHPLDLPAQIPSDMLFDPVQADVRSMSYSQSLGTERKYSADVNIKTNFKLGDFVNLELKAGAKYKYLTKETDKEKYLAAIDKAYFQATRDVANKYVDWFPAGPESGAGTGQGLVGFKDFVDPDYYNDELLLGDYTMHDMFDESKVREFHQFMWDNPMGFTTEDLNKPFYNVWKESLKDDFYGNETYLGAYINPTLSIGKNNLLTFIPGIRYEKNKTSYTGQRLPLEAGLPWGINESTYSGLEVTRERENEFFLPMLHLILRPTKWSVIKSSYTHTLTRPQFRNIVPSWNVVGGRDSYIAWNNPNIKPGLSKNIDVNVSIHGSKLGLFSVGWFNKEIEDMIFWNGKRAILQKDLDAGFYDGLEEMNEYTLVNANGYQTSYPINNPNDSYVSGIELEYQSNFYFLPGVLSGLVFNANYTYFKSEAKYPDVYTIVDEDFSSPTFLETTYIDTFYVSKLLNQANHILNVTLGWDYKAFSIRGSMKYTDGMFSRDHAKPGLREYADERFSYDVSITQGVPKWNLSFFGNLTNLSRSKEITLNGGTGYPTKESYGGIGLALGVRYRFKKM